YGYWALSDIYEEINTGPATAYREGNFGLLLKGDQNIPESFDVAKPAFNAFRLLHMMTDTTVTVSGGMTDAAMNGVGAVATPAAGAAGSCQGGGGRRGRSQRQARRRGGPGSRARRRRVRRWRRARGGGMGGAGPPAGAVVDDAAVHARGDRTPVPRGVRTTPA